MASKKKRKNIIIFSILILLTSLLLIGFYYFKTSQNYYKYPSRFPESNPCAGSNAPCAIEEHGKMAVASFPSTAKLVQKYGAENVSISALGYRYIKDETYTKRLLGDNFDHVHCVISVSSPEGVTIYIETGDENGTMSYIPYTEESFEKLISDASDEDKQILYENMNSDQTFVRRILELY